MNWDKGFKSPFKSDVYFFSTRMQTNQKWGTATPITIRDKEFGAVRLRGYGIYSWHVYDPGIFFKKISGTRDMYRVGDIEGQLRNTIVSRMTDTFAESSVPFLDMAANQTELASRIAEGLKSMFAELGLALDSFVVENLSLPEELQKLLDARIGMNMIGDMNRYTQFQVANSMPVAAANPGGGAGLGMGLGAGMAMGQQMMQAMRPGEPPAPSSPPTAPAPGGPAPAGSSPSGDAGSAGAASGSSSTTKFCINCGHQIPRPAKFCAECGSAQG
jgi:membrane protease subunit (stomatin/prohibitin family)